jgi:hypothetical protein
MESPGISANQKRAEFQAKLSSALERIKAVTSGLGTRHGFFSAFR